MDDEEEEEVTDLKLQLFHNTVREHIIFLLLIILLYSSSYVVVSRFRRRDRDDLYSNDEDEVLVYRISFWLCTFTLAVAEGAAMLLPVSIASNEVLLLYPNSYYVKWLNSSLIQGLWNHVFLFSNLSLFIFLPFVYLFSESTGFVGNKKGILPRVYETFTVFMLMAIIVLVLTAVLSAVFGIEKLQFFWFLNLGSVHQVFQQQQLQRLQRQGSVPQATQHLPGSPRFGSSPGSSNNTDSSAAAGNQQQQQQQQQQQHQQQQHQQLMNGLSMSPHPHTHPAMMGVGGMGSGGGNGIIGLGGGGGNYGATLGGYGQSQQANDFYGRAQTAGGGGSVAGGNANSEFVKQELRAVVSVRAQQAAAAATGGAGVGGGVAQRGQTPQSPLQQGSVIGGGGGIVGGVNSTNTMGNVTPTGSGNVSNSMLNTPPDPTLSFSFETPDFFTVTVPPSISCDSPL